MLLQVYIVQCTFISTSTAKDETLLLCSLVWIVIIFKIVYIVLILIFPLPGCWWSFLVVLSYCLIISIIVYNISRKICTFQILENVTKLVTIRFHDGYWFWLSLYNMLWIKWLDWYLIIFNMIKREMSQHLMTMVDFDLTWPLEQLKPRKSWLQLTFEKTLQIKLEWNYDECYKTLSFWIRHFLLLVGFVKF